MVEIFYAAELVDFRHVCAVSEGIGGEIQIKILYAPNLGQIFSRVLDMTQQRLAGRHVLVCLYPCRGGYFPASLCNAGFDALHQLRIIFFHDFVYRSLRLGEAELRILIHDI